MMGLQAGQCYSLLRAGLICLGALSRSVPSRTQLNDEVSTGGGSYRVIVLTNDPGLVWEPPVPAPGTDYLKYLFALILDPRPDFGKNSGR